MCNFYVHFTKFAPIMPAFCSLLLPTHYAKNFAGKIDGSLALAIVSRSQTLFFLLCGGEERKGSGEHSIASSLGYPEIVGILLRSFWIVVWCKLRNLLYLHPVTIDISVVAMVTGCK